MSFTSAQKTAIGARGNVLVVAGAGTGKTSTLVERCLDCLVREQSSLDQMLIVTFTDAAAAEIRQRIRLRLEEQLAARPEELHWSEQLALFDAAHIGTLHGFCFKLIRQHFYLLELDPQLAVMPEEEARMLADDVLEKILQAHYAGKDEASEAVRQLIQAHSSSSDLPIRALVLKLHHYTQTLRDPAEWIDAQLAMFQSPEPAQWREWLATAIRDWHDRWLPALKSLSAENPKAAACAHLIEKLSPRSRAAELAAAFADVQASDNGEWPARKKTALRKPIEDFFDEALFLGPLVPAAGASDPLLEDWNWARGQMATLLNLTREFGEAFASAKREQGSVDFHDLEQHSLRLLWDRATKTPTAIARHWQKQLRFLFVDEYQDINEAQDAILTALSGDGDGANRFLVGDVKQSIYRFRLAAPHIFQNYARAWSGDAGKVIPLAHNFRSREAILSFVNALFSELMRPDIGGVAYDENARLQFGAPDDRRHLSLARDSSPRVELHLRLKGASDAAENDEDAAADPVHLEESSQEARLAGLRLLELKNSGHPIWDEDAEKMRPVEWPDMAVLLRSPSGKSENFTKEFARLGIPLTVARSGFYDSMEINDLISLLQLLDNPLQDVPALAVLHSPLVGMSPDELAAIRLAAQKQRYWTALLRFHESQTKHSAWPKADRFLKDFSRWRRLARQISLSRCLETVLNETHYGAWLFTQSRGTQRHANVQRLLALARQFDQFQRQGLARFLHFVDAQKEAETEPSVAPISGGDSVTLMSIHQSKGLEFPVVVLADLGKQFNFSDLTAEIILDEKFGLCPRIKPPHTGRRYPSLPYWLARQRQKQETLGEELRLLYVAMTRARDTLILTGNLTRKKFESRWLEGSGVTLPAQIDARNYLDWLAAWTTHSSETLVSADPGQNQLFRWTIYETSDLQPPEAAPTTATSEATPKLDAPAWNKLQQRLAWKYSHASATTEPAKTTVTAVRRRVAEEADETATPLFRFQSRSQSHAPSRKLSATEIGLAHHTFLQHVSLERTDTLDGLKHETTRLVDEKFLTAEEAAHLDLSGLAAFWQSDLGKKIRAKSDLVRRELAFTARMSPTELATTPSAAPDFPDQEFVVVQGAADLIILQPEEILLVDFKTDHFAESQLADKVKTYEVQLRLYAKALHRIYQRPVTETYLHFLALRRTVPLKFT